MANFRLGVLVASFLLVFALAGVVAPAAGAQNVQVSAATSDLSIAEPVAPTFESGPLLLGGPAAPSSDANASTDNETLFLQLPEPITTAEARENLTTQELKTAGESLRSTVVDRVDRIDGVTVERTFWITNAVLVSVDREHVDVDRELRSLPAVEAVHPDVQFEHPAASVAASNDPHNSRISVPTLNGSETLDSEVARHSTTVEPRASSTTYGIDMVEAPETWERYETRGEGARVAVLDTGVNASHPDIDLARNGWAEFGLNGDQLASTPHDNWGHGTHVSGTVAGSNASGTAIGVAPEAELLHGKVFQGDDASTSSLVAALEWAVDSDADVISMSLGQQGYHASYLSAVENARSQGTVVVAASGNLPSGQTNSPANYYDVLSVGAVDSNQNVAPFSSGEIIQTDTAWGSVVPGHWPDQYVVPRISAPGVDIWSATESGGFTSMDGTSMATPHVSGTATLLRSLDDGASPAEVEDAILGSAEHPNGDRVDTGYGVGILNAEAAATALTDPSELVVTGLTTSEPTEGEEIVIQATLANMGEADAVQSVELSLDESQVDAVPVTLGPNETTTISFEVETELGDAPSVDIAVRTEDDEETRTVAVQRAGASFEVPTVDYEQPIAGEDFVLEATIENVGGTTGTKTVTTTFESKAIEREVTLDPGERTVETFAFSTSESDIGFRTVIVNTGDQTYPLSSSYVLAPAEFTVDAVEVPNSVRVDERIDVNATLTNVGDVAGQANVSLSVGQVEAAIRSAEIDAGATEEVRFENVSMSSLAPGTHQVSVGTQNDRATSSLTIDNATNGPESIAQSYTNQNGIVDTDGAQRAVSDWLSGAITQEDVRAVMGAWLTGQQIG